MVYHICYHFWSTGCYLFRLWYHFLGCYHLCYHLVLSFILSYHLMLSFFDVIIWCYHLVLSFILCHHLMLSFLTVCKYYNFCVIIFPCTGWVLSFMFSFNVIILCYHFPLFSFFWKRDTLYYKSSDLCPADLNNGCQITMPVLRIMYNR